MGRMSRRFLTEERAEGTTGGAIRLVVWAVVALAVVGLVGPKVYSAMNQGGTCVANAGGVSTSGVSATAITGASC